MSAVAIACTGNEADIIESFVRHHAEHFTEIIIYDDNSTDSTASIIDSLMKEGLPVHCVAAAKVDWNVLDASTRLMHMAFNEFGADWVAPLDIDEFIELPGDEKLQNWLPKPEKYPCELRWSNFIWARDRSEFDEPDVTKRLRSRMPPRTDSRKLILPRGLVVGDSTAWLTGGNHGIFSHGALASEFFRNPSLGLCHYPIRSVEQFMTKCALMMLRYAALPDRPPTAGFQYHKPFGLIKTGRVDELMDYMEKESRVYALQAGGRMVGEIRDAPLNNLGGALKYSNGSSPALTNIINAAEKMATQLSELERRLAMEITSAT